ncbi:VOC family protein [Occultella gossypii]|uniref:VOC family protein n=1 Tax=Occultella gossypii TaxID=2800820 RepID=A0ABS7S483_9MICO|nr:VOC family protein [Occultella gossypii]MBZ2194590.1 VOC family protein [Occultella gossypii]
MTIPTTIPNGYHTVNPWLINARTAEVIDFLVEVFEATERGRMEVDGVIEHAEVQIGDSVIMMFDSPPSWPPTPCFLRFYVPDDAAVHRRAIAAGARVITEPTEMFWGDRTSRIADPFGNLYWIHQHVADVDEAEAERRMRLPRFQEAMASVQSAEFHPGH